MRRWMKTIRKEGQNSIQAIIRIEQAPDVRIISKDTCIEKWMRLCDDPRIEVIDNYISIDDCNHLITKGEARLKRALVSSNEGGKKSAGRTGSNCWIPFEDDLKLHSICNSISEYVQIPLEHCENLQLIHYKSDQEYRPHFDAFDLKSERGKRCTKKGGQRITTALIYLNEVNQGGGTIFPKLDIIVEPKIGRIVIFDNTIGSNLMPHPLSLHGGLPVTEGEKWAVNLWFRKLSIQHSLNPEKLSENTKLTFNASKSNLNDTREYVIKLIKKLGAYGLTARKMKNILKIIDSNANIIYEEIDHLSEELKQLNDIFKTEDHKRNQHWIAKCLVMGRKEDYIRNALINKGLNEKYVDSEIQIAKNSPYIKGGQTVYKRDVQDKHQDSISLPSNTIKQNTEVTHNINTCGPLREGDLLPFFIAEGNKNVLDIQSKGCHDFILIYFTKSIFNEVISNVASNIHCKKPIYLISENATDANSNYSIYQEANLRKLFNPLEDGNCLVIHVQKNLKISALESTKPSIEKINQILLAKNYREDDIVSIPAPVLVVPNVISSELCEELIIYASKNATNGHVDNRKAKSRFHIHPNKAMMNALDEKLCKSLLPEIHKVFYADISHRESYKICSYDAQISGNFMMHRDTIDPYRHRRFGFSLSLNDNYFGGGLNFPEYNNEIVRLEKGSAIIFPGSLFHQIKPIEKGIRWVLISFLFTKEEARPNKDEKNMFSFESNLDGINLKSLQPKRAQ